MDEMRASFQRLREAAATGTLPELCDRFGAKLLVGYGSASRSGQTPAGDVDVAVRFASSDFDLLGFLDRLSQLAETSRIDLMDLAAARPVAREHALAYGEPFVERPAGAFARAQMAAMTERMDTAWMRQMQLEQLATWR